MGRCRPPTRRSRTCSATSAEALIAASEAGAPTSRASRAKSLSSAPPARRASSAPSASTPPAEARSLPQPRRLPETLPAKVVVRRRTARWSLYGARGCNPSRMVPHGDGRTQAKPLAWVATSCRNQRTVRRGSTVRVRQRALQKLRTWHFFVSVQSVSGAVGAGVEHLFGALRL
jgi:hypothetical protein